jgi:predicted AAA+ superfamily ATPase
MRDNIDQLLRAILTDIEARDLPSPTPRDVDLPALPGKADAVVGMRRAGKSWLLLRRIRDLLEAGNPRSRILYLEFEDERLAGLAAGDLGRVEDAFYQLHPDSHGEECWYFFDEIQNVPGWELFVRRLLADRRLHIAVTGSSAKLLSKEIATSLRGRSLTTELLPFSFREVLRHRGIDAPTRWPASQATRARLRNEFERYLQVGGFPEVQELDDGLRQRVLQSYLDVAILRDIVERHTVANAPLLRALVRRLLRLTGARSSVHSIAQDLRSQGFTFGKDAVYELMEHVQDAYLAFLLPVHAKSEKRRQVNPRKVYAVDHGLVRACVAPASDEVGHHLENIVYLALRRRGEVLGYHLTNSDREVDFVATTPGGTPELFQVCARLADAATRERELKALAEAVAETGIRTATIVSRDEEGEEEVEGCRVRIVPAWRWLLE